MRSSSTSRCRRVLDQVAPARTVVGRVGQQPADHVELVEARPDLHGLLSAGLLILGPDDLGVVLQDVRQPVAGQDALPQVVGLEPGRVGGVARPVAPAQVEGQEPRGLALEVRAEAHLVFVHGEVHHAAPELEEPLARVAVALVLLDGVLDRLLGQAVLQLERGHREAVNEEAQVEGELGLVAAVAELARNAEAVGVEALLGLEVASGRRAVEQVDLVRAVLEAMAQHVDGAALADLSLQAGQELAPRRAVLAKVERLGHAGLGGPQERRELRQVHAVLAVVVGRLAADPPGTVGGRPFGDSSGWRDARVARMACESRADEALEPALAGIGGHTVPALPLRWPLIKQPSSKRALA